MTAVRTLYPTTLVSSGQLLLLRVAPRYALLINLSIRRIPLQLWQIALTPTLALNSFAATTPAHWRVDYWDGIGSGWCEWGRRPLACAGRRSACLTFWAMLGQPTRTAGRSLVSSEPTASAAASADYPVANPPQQKQGADQEENEGVVLSIGGAEPTGVFARSFGPDWLE